MRDLPSGTVTFLFTDVEGSTRLLHALGPDAYADALATHRRMLREAFTAHGGVEVDTQGDAFFVAFPTAPGAVAAATQANEALKPGPIKVRMGLHTGAPFLTDEGYVGADVHRAARIAAAGHGGQVLVSLATAHLLGGTTLRDLGDHRLKDLTAPERIYQLGTEPHPPLKTLHQTNLPVPATAFLGRDTELADIGALLARDEVHLLTLTGPGGTGKTRLALQAAASAADTFAGGVWWVPLAPLRDPQLVLSSAAQALGAGGDLAEHIGDKRLLLLLDNFEHLVSAAADLAPLLSACPNLTVLVTSREPLHLGGEHEYAVDPLRQPEAVELFRTRALAARPDCVANGEVAIICQRLDYLPLAIELAAARVKLLSPRAILERLEQRLPLLTGGTRDAPDRQRTLRATIEWSHDLLTDAEQRLFARLAVFRGGCTLEAAEQVADADLDTLSSLVDKSLVRMREDRFWMLETIREFALERLDASGDADEMRDRHANHFLALAEEAEPHLRGSPRDWLDRLEADNDNLRAAFDRLAAAGDAQLPLRMGAALWRFWAMRGYAPEGRGRLERALAADASPTPARAFALNGATANAMDYGDPVGARRYAEEALALHRSLGDRWGIAHSTFLLGYVCAEERDWPTMRDLLEESLVVFTELGDDHYILLAGRNLAWAYYDLGQSERGRALHQANLARARAIGNRRIEAGTLQGLAWRAVEAGNPIEAVEMVRQSYPINRELGETPAIAGDLLRLARAVLDLGRPRAAATLLGRLQVLCDETGTRSEATDIDAALAATRQHLDEAEFSEAWEQGMGMTLDEVIELGLAATA
ncbi:MAG: ATP-binding protein [Candidatus Limnocylindria bacterium]